MKNRGQIAIFVIIAIVLVVGVAFILLLRQGNVSINLTQTFDPQSYMDTCIRDAVKEKVPIIMKQGGVIEPSDFKLSEDVPVQYVCKNVNLYEPCVNQYPLFITHLKQELESSIKNNVGVCLASLKEEMERRSYEVSFDAQDPQVTLKPGVIEVKSPVNFRASKSGETKNYESFSSNIRDYFFDVSSVAQEVISQEAQYCYFEYAGYSLTYPAYDIRVKTFSDNTKVYTIKHASGEIMNIAIRGCALPAGY